MDSVDVQIPLTDGTHAAATASHPAPMSVPGTKSGRDGDKDFEDGQVARVLATTSVGLKRGRRDSSSSTSSSSSSTSQENAQKIDAEGETVMRHPALSEEYKFRHLRRRERKGHELRETREESFHGMTEIFSTPKNKRPSPSTRTSTRMECR